ncbi:trimethylamine methyltransferase family protein [Pelagibius sp. Alg239-R121]|uniref:trimethylamine methyltransferase family protein n=1 Tax=Pelagibius sp. Alg239-R121 TaxID=2993448 RepID=UPI0024A64C64|nr:trimethylamine methyltransferase family protein [Pelagibius sp. Alg239-R121]
MRRGRRTRIDEDAEAAALTRPVIGPVAEGGRFRPLSDPEEASVHEAVLDLLENLGLSQAIPSMIEKVTAEGGRLTHDDRLLFPRELVLKTVENARRDLVLYGQQPGLELDLSGGRVHMSSGGASPNIVDLETGRYRESTARDLYDAARLVDALEHVQHFSRALVARDATDPLSLDVNTAYACLCGTAKHVSISASDPANVKTIADICYSIAGGEAAFRARPFLTIMVCHVVPPMRFAEEACQTLEAAILAGFPVQIISAGQAGATSPASIAGSLVQAVAETLAGLVFARLVDPAAAAIFAPKPLVADLRTGAMCGGGGEQAILMAAAAQMGRYYNLPTSSIAGITDAKIADVQHGYEKNLAVSLAAQAGSNLITQSCGMQASLLGVSLEAYVVDNDMLGGILRSVRGVEVSGKTLAADVIAEVCRGEGHYLGHPETLARMKADYVYPVVADRRSPTDWEEDGGLDMRTRARARARDILARHYPGHLAEETDRLLRDRYHLLLSRADIGRPA